MKGQKAMTIKFKDNTEIISAIDGLSALTRIIGNEQSGEIRSKGFMVDNALMLISDILNGLSEYISDNNGF